MSFFTTPFPAAVFGRRGEVTVTVNVQKGGTSGISTTVHWSGKNGFEDQDKNNIFGYPEASTIVSSTVKVMLY